MVESEDKLERLRVSIEAGAERFKKDHELNQSYVDEIIVPLLKDVLESQFTPIKSRHALDSSEVNDGFFVIHYTGITNLVSMLRCAADDNGKSSLRLYDSVHFNDPDEGNYFDRYLELSKEHEILPNKKAHHAYITSFIRPHPNPKKDMSDNLVFWRTYGKEGKGCSLTLRVPHGRIQKVLYGVDKVRCTDNYLKNALDTLSPLLSICEEAMEQVRETLLNTIEGYIEKVRYLFKSEAYEYERECRLVIPEPDADTTLISFEYQEVCGSDVRIRHYYEDEQLDVKRLLVTGSVITLGPRVSNPNNVRYYLEAMLQEANLAGPKIRISEIPYQ